MIHDTVHVQYVATYDTGTVQVSYRVPDDTGACSMIIYHTGPVYTVYLMDGVWYTV